MASIKGQPQPQPTQLPDAVPNKKSAVESFFEDEYNPPEIQSSAQGESYAPVELQPESPPSTLSQGLDYASRGLDYAGGFIRSGLANVAGIVQDVAQGKNPLEEQPIVTEEDLKLAAQGKAPSSAEYLKRLGVGEGGSFNVPGLGKVTARGAAGLAADIATDPLTILGKLTKEIPYLRGVLNSTNLGTEALGEAVYKSSLSGLKKLGKEGQEALSKELIKSGAPVGGIAKIADKVQEVSGIIGKTRQAMYEKVTGAGTLIDSSEPLKRAEAVIKNMLDDPGLRSAGLELQELMDAYKSAGQVPIEVMSKWKTNLYNALPKSAFGPHGKLTGHAKAFKAALAGDFRERIIQTGNKVEKGLGDAIDELNSKWGVLLDAADPLQAAKKQGMGNLGLAIDGAVLASGYAANGPEGAAKAYLAKKAFGLASSPAARTAVGKGLMNAGRAGIPDIALRQSVIRSQRPEVPEE